MPPLAPQVFPVAGYGSDISTFPDLDPSFSLLSGPRVVGEAIARRLTTPPGSLPDSSAYGYDVRQLLELELDEADLAEARAAIARQVEAEERVLGADGIEVFLVDERLSVRVQLVLAEGPFALTLQVSALSTSLLFEAA